MSSLTRHAHSFVKKHLSNGDLAIDLTAGNGLDTLFLAQCVAQNGRVVAFDIQATAIEATRQRLDQAGLLSYVSLHESSHAEWPEFLSTVERNSIRGIMANLGYLPGGDITKTTQASSTRVALQHACKLLSPGGVMSVLVYTGHPGGNEEAEAVRKVLDEHSSTRSLQIDRFPDVIQANSPILYLCTKQRA